MIWPDDYVAELRRLVELDLTMKQIGDRLNVSKSAVIGKLNRLGLSRGHSVPKGRQPRPERRVTVKRLAKRGNNHFMPALIEETVELPVERIEDQAIPMAQRRTLLQLEAHHCRWPVGDPGDVGFFFCAGEAVRGLPYCTAHCAVAYQPAPVRSRAPWVASRGERA